MLFPVNWVNYFQADFGPQVVAKAQERGAACLALKAMAHSRLPQGAPKRYAKCWYDPIDEPELAELALRFALSQPITAALPPGETSLFEMAHSHGPIASRRSRMLKWRTCGSAPRGIHRCSSCAAT